ncbi:MAG: diguanylate cyclase [Microcystaceae cyanobacterium]
MFFDTPLGLHKSQHRLYRSGWQLLSQVSLIVIAIDAFVHGLLHQHWLPSSITFSSVFIVCIKLIYDAKGVRNAFNVYFNFDRFKSIEQELQDKLEEFENFMTHAPILAWVVDKDGIVHYGNNHCLEFLGKAKNEVIGQSIHNLLPDDMAWQDRRHNQQVIDTQAILETEETGIDSKGKIHHYHVCKFPIHHRQKNILAGGVALDITEKYQAKIDLEKAKEKYKRLVDEIGHQFLVYSYDLSLNITYVSNNFEEIFGMRKEAIMGQKWPDTIDWLPDDLEESLVFTQLVRENKIDKYSGEMRFIHPDGQQRLIRYFEHTIRDKKNNFIATEGILQDITQDKEDKSQLIDKKQQLESKLTQLDHRNKDLVLLSELSDFLQSANSVTEAWKIMPRLLQPLFPDCSGCIFMNDSTGEHCQKIVSWGELAPPIKSFTVNSCWALRRGRMYLCEPQQSSAFCGHQELCPTVSRTLCIPILSNQEVFGLLFLCTAIPDALSETKQQLARTTVEQIGLAISNLQLREQLERQSIIDPLTELYNRRYLDTFLSKELARARRENYSVGIIMLDVDHFKQYNDLYGHDAGDFVLKTVSHLLNIKVRHEDIACRYGGEEMTLILPNASLTDTQKRAEEIRVSLSQLVLNYQNQSLNQLTASLGVAAFPEHGDQCSTLLQSADTALYQAKATGRNRVIVAN